MKRQDVPTRAVADIALTRTIIEGATANAPNYVQVSNPSQIGPANSLQVEAPAIAAKGSGVFFVIADGCPFPTGSPQVITTVLFRDAVQLPPVRLNLPAGPGDHSPHGLQCIDVPGDTLPHVYSVLFTPQSGQLEDNANHVQVTVFELVG